MAFTSSIFSHIPLNNQRIYSPSFHKPKLLGTTVTAASIAAYIDGDTLAVIGGGSVAALAAAISLKDPERRRRPQAEEMDIRHDHSKTVENVLKMLKGEGSLEGVSVCDAGCGTGSLVIPLAKEGAAKEQLQAGSENVVPVMPKFEVKDLESLDGMYDTVRVGELFPGPSRATRAYPHAEADGEWALKKVGWKIRKRGLITTQFYFARLVEAVPVQMESRLDLKLGIIALALLQEMVRVFVINL
ncbi:hypothetical protein POTOM_049669 [Populus tomentosa]|uniref:Magnesium-protoporphyrin IX methyltransferase C-terminal domain-containing protein n=1 Tax=Populus tomentosa TaxID=118781 RepID=A0A8X7YEV9_POPTO|nr:hypothetical protein POTOM_049669 [Populus tomentosa]